MGLSRLFCIAVTELLQSCPYPSVVQHSSRAMFGLCYAVLLLLALLQNPTEPLEAAQLRKLNRLIDKAQIQAHHRVLEIGFGWGSLALEVIRRTGCHVTGITLSRQQLQLATERVKAAGLEVRTALHCTAQ